MTRMKTLLLLRHAKAGWEEADQRDFDRPLNGRGKGAAKAMGNHLRNLQLTPEMILCSPAVRTRETWALVQDAAKLKASSHFIDDIYMASAAALLGLIQGTEPAVSTLLMIGHNPGFEDLALQLVGHGDQVLRAALEEKFPTATLAEISFPLTDWQKIGRGSGTLTRFVRPRDLGFSLEDEG
jgi:phosphohistidine phosphatase